MSIATTEIRLDKRVTSFVKERRKLLIDGNGSMPPRARHFPSRTPPPAR